MVENSAIRRIRELIEELYVIGSGVPKFWLDQKYSDRLLWMKMAEDRLNERQNLDM